MGVGCKLLLLGPSVYADREINYACYVIAQENGLTTYFDEIEDAIMRGYVDDATLFPCYVIIWGDILR